MGIKTKKRNNTNWHESTVMGILKNEKYTGLLVQGKTYTVNTMGHKRKDNNGEANCYKVKDNHEAIISQEDFDKVQTIIASRRTTTNSDGIKRGTTTNSTQSEFTSKIVCAYCGKHYVRRITHPGTKYQKIKWCCSTVAKRGKANCPKSVIIDDDYLKQGVVGVINNLREDKDFAFYLPQQKLNELLKNADENKDKFEGEIKQYRRNLDLKVRKKSKILDMFLEEKITEDEFIIRREAIDNEITAIKKSLNELEALCYDEEVKKKSSKQIVQLMSEGKAEGFNKELFDLLISQIVVGGKRTTDFVDDPKSLHYELICYNLYTDLKKVVTNGELRYTMNGNLEEESHEIGRAHV